MRFQIPTDICVAVTNSTTTTKQKILRKVTAFEKHRKLKSFGDNFFLMSNRHQTQTDG